MPGLPRPKSGADPQADPDRDGVVNEIDPALVDHLEFCLLNYFKPATYQQTDVTALGRALMDGFGCTSCHKASMVVEKDRRAADVETRYDPARGIFKRLFATASPLFVEVATGDGLPPLRNPARGRFVVENFFADLKRHDLGPRFHELNLDGSVQKEFMTEPLWGVGSTPRVPGSLPAGRHGLEPESGRPHGCGLPAAGSRQHPLAGAVPRPDGPRVAPAGWKSALAAIGGLARCALRAGRRRARLRLQDQSIARERHHLELAVGLLRLRIREEQQAVSLQCPAAAQPMRAVVRARPRLEQGAVAAQVEAAPPARGRQRVTAGTKDQGIAGVLLVRVDPAPAEPRVCRSGSQARSSRRLCASERRGPCSVACMRATCWGVKSSIAASST
jgi:hypothetical protein